MLVGRQPSAINPPIKLLAILPPPIKAIGVVFIAIYDLTVEETPCENYNLDRYLAITAGAAL
jgi:hypothetical protein